MISVTRRTAPPVHSRMRWIASPIAALALFALAVAVALPCDPAHAQDAPQTDDEKAFYAIGVSMSQQLKTLAPVSDREIDFLVLAIRDALEGTKPAVDPQAAQPLVRKMVTGRQQAALNKEKEAGAAFAAEQAKRKGAKTTPSGLVIIETRAAEGPKPGPTDTVRVHYHGTLRDGTVFDSSVDRGQPTEFPLNNVIPCWTEGVAMMTVGSKATLICPSKIAYRERGAGADILPGATLRFEVELLEILKPPAPMP